MKIRIVMACAALLTSSQAFQTVARAEHARYVESITVKGIVRGPEGDYALTFNRPVALPGLSLAPGTYLFKRPIATVIQVSSAAGAPYKMFNTLPIERAVPSEGFTVQLGSPKAEGAPIRIVAVFAPGERTGRQLMW